MKGEGIRLRAATEADLVELERFETDPSALGEFEWFGFADPKSRRRRWEQDGLLGGASSLLAVSLAAGDFVGMVTWRDLSGAGTPEGGCFEIGIALLPEHRGHGIGTAAQGLLVRYLFDHTLANRLQAGTEVDNLAEQGALERLGFRREGVMRGVVFRTGRWRDLALYARLRDEPVNDQVPESSA